MTAQATLEVPEQVLEFTLGEEQFCVGIESVDEIVKTSELTELPDSPRHVVGMMDLRGETTIVVNPKRVFDITDDGGTDQVIIFDHDEDDQQVGWLVDRAHRVSALEDPELDPVEDNQYINGVVSGDGEFTLWVDPIRVNSSVT